MRSGRWIALAVVLVIACVAGGIAWLSHLSALAAADRVSSAGAVPVAPAAPASTAPPARPQAGASDESSVVEGLARTKRIDARWLASTSSATGIPTIALDAYARAVSVMDASQPACELGWNTLAAIGYVESAHGSLDGAVVDDTGRVTPPIIGPALDGRVYDPVADTDDGAWDGDDRWDHAIGPMQFLPSVWRADAVDGDGDGIEDPQDLYDAALTAARYLCASGVDLADGPAWERAVRAYNPADSYVASVRAAAVRYAAAVR